MPDQRMDFYQQLRCKISDWLATEDGRKSKWADYILLAPDLFHLLCKLALDRDVLITDKGKLAVAIAYFVTPVDLIPEIIAGPFGYVDDIALAAHVLNSIINNTDPEIVKKHWAGDGDILKTVQGIIKIADQMVGGSLWKKLKAMVK
ncbi:MAG: YkvA family protein [Bacillota bacterium]